MLQVCNLTKTYQSKQGTAVKALNGVSVGFPDTGLVFILGKSGSGKSTLLHLLGGLDMPDEGEIIVKGRSSKDFAPADFDGYRNTYVGFVFQEYNLIPSYTVGDNVSLALELQGKQATRDNVDAVLRRLELTDNQNATLYGRPVGELSGGQKQRVAIARALIKSPDIILADEPTGALDSETGEQLYGVLSELAENKLVIVVTHDRDSAEKYGNRIIELKDGQIVRDVSKNGAGFAETAASNNAETKSAEGYHPIQSKLPFRRAFKMGAGGLKVKKFRLILSIVLSVVAFTLFGCSITAAMADQYKAELKTLYENDIHVVVIKGDSYYNKGGDYESREWYLTQNQVETIKEYNHAVDPMKTVLFRTDWSKHLNVDTEVMYEYKNGNPYYMVGLTDYYDQIEAAELDSATGEADANLRPDSRFINKDLCKLPDAYDEIAITDMKAEMFMRFGYKSENGTITKIKAPDDLIGKKLGGLTICGVYETEQDRAYFEQNKATILDYLVGSDERYQRNYTFGAYRSLITYCFVRTGFGRARNDLTGIGPSPIGEARGVLLKLSGNLMRDRALFRDLTYKKEPFDYSARIVSPFSGFVSSVSAVTEYAAMIGAIAAIVFSVFTALLTMNFLTVSLDFKKKDIGILRALGARKKDVVTICLIESLIIAAINFIVSLAAVLILSFVFNGYFFLSVFIVGFLPITLLFLLCFVTTALATILPIIKVTSRKPIDIINGK